MAKTFSTVASLASVSIHLKKINIAVALSFQRLIKKTMSPIYLYLCKAEIYHILNAIKIHIFSEIKKKTFFITLDKEFYGIYSREE